jgi:general secretion pathway protein C
MTAADFFSHPQFRQKLPTVVNTVVLLLLTAGLAEWTWLLAKPSLPPVMLAPPPAPTPAATFSIQPLLSAHLFGEVSQELPSGRMEILPLSSLNLVLAGVIASYSGGYALISVNGQPQESFATGQTITAGAVLEAVYPDRAIIRRNGALESLMLEGADQAQPPQGVAMAAPSHATGPSAPVAQEIGPNNYMLSRDRLAEQLRTPEFLKQATMVPAPGGGFLVRNIQPNSLYGKLGLRTGDVIKSVNGQPINTAEDAMKVYQQISSISSVQLEVTRAGRNEMLNYHFAQN